MKMIPAFLKKKDRASNSQNSTIFNYQKSPERDNSPVRSDATPEISEELIVEVQEMPNSN